MIRVLIAGMPRMLEGVVAGVVAAQDDMVMASGAPTPAALSATLWAGGADVVILGGTAGRLEEQHEGMLFDHPRLRLVLIDADARRGSVYELAATETTLADISADSLARAIRSQRPVRAAGGSHERTSRQ